MRHEIKINRSDIETILDAANPITSAAPGPPHPRPLALLHLDGPQHPHPLFAADLSGSPLTVRKIAIHPDPDDEGGMILELE